MPIIESVTLENFRCFREKQTVGLAPLTLLVGENSTGKTSFLALLRAIYDFSTEGVPPNFKRYPYDLGSFVDIANNRGRGGKAASFVAGFSTTVHHRNLPFEDGTRGTRQTSPVSFEFGFAKQPGGTAPIPDRVWIEIEGGDEWAKEIIATHREPYSAMIGTKRGSWRLKPSQTFHRPDQLGEFARFLSYWEQAERLPDHDPGDSHFQPIDSAQSFGRRDVNALEPVWRAGLRLLPDVYPSDASRLAFASAPIPTRPFRTYDPVRWDRNPEGDHIPMQLAELSLHDTAAWLQLKKEIERFGQAAGLFDEIHVRQLGRSGNDPFQIQIRLGGKRLKGPYRNLVDVGDGVSQVLPIAVDLVNPSTPTSLYLLQEPEIALHPSAQAALGSLFCEVAANDRQLIVETHSDHLIDRVRMDVRDGKTALRPEDVRILYFEREDLDVKIHEITYDKMGNLQNTPPGYRSFFMREIERSLWPPD